MAKIMRLSSELRDQKNSMQSLKNDNNVLLKSATKATEGFQLLARQYEKLNKRKNIYIYIYI